MRRLAVAVLGLWWPTIALPQEGFIVIGGIENGPATVLVDGVRKGQVSTFELTLTVPAGRRELRVQREGFADFVQALVVPSGDVIQVQVRLVPRTATFTPDNARAGSAAQEMGRVRIVHLDPVRVPVEYNGKILGETPGTMTVPVGAVVLTIYGRSICLSVNSNDSGFVRLRAGQVEEVRNVSRCTDTGMLLQLPGIPATTRVVVNGEPHQIEVGERGGSSVLLETPGAKEVTLSAPGRMPVAFRFTAGAGAVVTATIDFGDPRPDVVEPRLPDPPNPPTPDTLAWPVAPRAPDEVQIALLRDIWRGRPRKTRVLIGALVGGAAVGYAGYSADARQFGDGQIGLRTTLGTVVGMVAGGWLASLGTGNRAAQEHCDARTTCFDSVAFELDSLRFAQSTYPTDLADYQSELTRIQAHNRQQLTRYADAQRAHAQAQTAYEAATREARDAQARADAAVALWRQRVSQTRAPVRIMTRYPRSQ